jgi:hypothetical protein
MRKPIPIEPNSKSQRSDEVSTRPKITSDQVERRAVSPTEGIGISIIALLLTSPKLQPNRSDPLTSRNRLNIIDRLPRGRSNIGTGETFVIKVYRRMTANRRAFSRSECPPLAGSDAFVRRHTDVAHSVARSRLRGSNGTAYRRSQHHNSGAVLKPQALRALLPSSSKVRTRELPGLAAVSRMRCPEPVSRRACREACVEWSKRLSERLR